MNRTDNEFGQNTMEELSRCLTRNCFKIIDMNISKAKKVDGLKSVKHWSYTLFTNRPSVLFLK